MQPSPTRALLAVLLCLAASAAAAAPDANSLATPLRALQAKLAEHGLELRVDQAFSYQRASEIARGEHDLGDYAYDLSVAWRATEHPLWGRGTLHSQWVGSVGLDHGSETLAGNLESVSTPNALIEEDHGAWSELAWEQSSPQGRLLGRVGRVDMKNAFDASRVANDPYGQFLAAELENNASIPFPSYGGLGAWLDGEPAEGWRLRVGAGQAGPIEPFAFWRKLDDDSWWVLAELEVSGRLGVLGSGALRLTPWHARQDGRSGFGVGLGLEQELGHERVVGFLRLGLGDGEVTPAEHAVSGGVAFRAPFGREDDAVAFGVAWSDPSAPGPAETLLELYYHLALTPSLGLTPDLQLVCPAAAVADGDCVLIGGLRLALRF